MSTTTATAPTATRVDPRECDRCGARAATRVVLPSGNDLVFCGHHCREYMPGLIAAASYAQALT